MRRQHRSLARLHRIRRPVLFEYGQRLRLPILKNLKLRFLQPLNRLPAFLLPHHHIHQHKIGIRPKQRRLFRGWLPLPRLSCCLR